jgi:hypothetical protein
MSDVPATFTGTPDSSALELDGFLADVEGERVVVFGALLLCGEHGGQFLTLGHGGGLKEGARG